MATFSAKNRLGLLCCNVSVVWAVEVSVLWSLSGCVYGGHLGWMDEKWRNETYYVSIFFLQPPTSVCVRPAVS